MIKEYLFKITKEQYVTVSATNEEDAYELAEENSFVDTRDEEIVDVIMVQFLLDKKFKGRMYVEGLYIQSDDNFDYGYNFNSDVVDLDRDRKAINYYELRKLTAASIISAESCEPEIFRAISNSCVDTRAIIDVLDDASEEFLEQYRDMIYKEKGLEENISMYTQEHTWRSGKMTHIMVN